jgi:hypothetical protein
MEVSDCHLRKNTYEIQEKLSMTVKQYLEPPYNSFRKGPPRSVWINANTSIDYDSTGVGTLCLDFEREHRLQVKLGK